MQTYMHARAHTHTHTHMVEEIGKNTFIVSGYLKVLLLIAETVAWNFADDIPNQN